MEERNTRAHNTVKPISMETRNCAKFTTDSIGFLISSTRVLNGIHFIDNGKQNPQCKLGGLFVLVDFNFRVFTV